MPIRRKKIKFFSFIVFRKIFKIYFSLVRKIDTKGLNLFRGGYYDRKVIFAKLFLERFCVKIKDLLLIVRERKDYIYFNSFVK